MVKQTTIPTEEATQTTLPNGDAAAPDASVATPDAATVESAPAKPSKRDTFRGRVSKRYPDLNMDDEDAYYDQMSGMMDEYEGYEKNSERLRNSMKSSPAFAEMLLAAREQDDFDPIVWMVRERGLDLQSAMDDPEYADKIAKARQEWLAKEAKGKKLHENMANNLPGTLEATRAALEEAGMGDKYEQIVGDIFQFADDITNGKWDPQIAVMMAKGVDYDNAVSGAREEGVAEGLNTKVDDKLRKLNGQQERVAGVQTPAKPKEPKKPSGNMFLA